MLKFNHSYMMNLTIPLHTSAEQHAQLCRLRTVFVQVCNDLTPEVQKTGVWERVTLHHLYYRKLREKYPQLGSQMVCNAIYAVSKVCRLVYQSTLSPHRITSRANQPLPLFRFAQSCPVYFDRHTLNIVSNGLSLFTMDGRVRFELQIPKSELSWFKTAKLHEIALQERQDQVFELSFELSAESRPTNSTPGFDIASNNEPIANTPHQVQKKIKPLHDSTSNNQQLVIPEYVFLESAA